MKTLAALTILAALATPAAAQSGYWTNGNQSIYGGGYTPQWNDTSNSGPAYQFAPPVQQYQPQRATECTYVGNHVYCN